MTRPPRGIAEGLWTPLISCAKRNSLTMENAPVPRPARERFLLFLRKEFDATMTEEDFKDGKVSFEKWRQKSLPP